MRKASVSKSATKANRVPVDPMRCIPNLDDRARRLVTRALKALEDSAVYRAEVMANPHVVKAHLKLRFAGLEREEFHALWIDCQNNLISVDCLSVGTLTQTSVYPREIVKAALAHNARSVIFAHNHPSGNTTPSDADRRLTCTLKVALATVDVKVLDHIIVAGNNTLSFAESCLL
jgi:DNA repair protein RadC